MKTLLIVLAFASGIFAADPPKPTVPPPALKPEQIEEIYRTLWLADNAHAAMLQSPEYKALLSSQAYKYMEQRQADSRVALEAARLAGWRIGSSGKLEPIPPSTEAPKP